MKLNTTKLKQALDKKIIFSGKDRIELAFDFGISKESLHRYVNGEMPKDKVKSFCEFLDLEIEDVLESI